MIDRHDLDETSFINNIFLFDDEEFIKKAYELILGRRADGSGLNHYKRLLSKTGSRARVALDLLGSLEGRANPHWDEMTIAVRKQKRREFWRRKRTSRFEMPRESAKRDRDLSDFAQSVSPRTMTLAKILASAEHG